MAGEGAIQQDAQAGGEDGQQRNEQQDRPVTPREQAMAAIAARRREHFEQEAGVKLEPFTPPAPKDEDADPDEDEAQRTRAELEAAAKDADGGEQDTTPQNELSAVTQIGRQIEGGIIELGPDDLKRAKVRVKVDGREELVDATKALGQYQKNAAAEVRLEQATKAQREAEETLREAQRRLEEATTAAERKKAEEAVQVATADYAEKKKEFLDAIYEGDVEKAGELFDVIVQKAVEVTGRVKEGATQVDPETIAKRAAELAVPVLKQVTSQESALLALKSDYPEIFVDKDYAFLADRKFQEIITADPNKSVGDALLEAGKAVAEKFGLKKASERRPQGVLATTRAERLAAKEGLDEPNATSARAAPTNVKPPRSASQIIDEMRKTRAANG